MKRSILIERKDARLSTELELGKSTIVHHTDKEFIYIEKMADGKWRLTATANVIDDFSEVVSLKLYRED